MNGHRGKWLPALGLALAAGLMPPPALAERYALLIGVSEYQDQDKGLRHLDGPMYDVAALQQALQARWGFKAANIVSLVNRDANRERILSELRALVDRTQSGDHVFIYFSGHGTSARDRANPIPLPYTSGALIPFDFPMTAPLETQRNTVLVGKRDLRPLLSQLDTGGRRVFVAFDSCYSGNAVRGLYRSALPGRPLHTRYIPLNPPAGSRRAMGDDPDLCGYRCGTREQEPYPYRNVFFLAAASDDEQAADIGFSDISRWPTVDSQPHGAFSDALLRVLTGGLDADSNRDGRLTYDELQRSIRQFMTERQYSQVPQRLPVQDEDRDGLAQHPVFEREREATAPPAVTTPPPRKAGPLRVYLADPDKALEGLLGKLPGISLVQEAPDVTIKRTGQDVELISGAGDLIVRLEKPAESAVVERIRQELWVKKLLRSGGRSGFNLTLDLVNGSRGITVVEGEEVAFSIRSERPAYVLLLDIDAQGRVNVLYPYNDSELAPLPAGQALRIPAETAAPIRVQTPFGTDQVVVYGFEKSPALLKRLMGKELAAGSPLLEELERLLVSEEGQYARSSFKLISVPRQAPGS